MERLIMASLVILLLMYIARQVTKSRRISRKGAELEETRIDSAVLGIEETIAEEKREQEERRARLAKKGETRAV